MKVYFGFNDIRQDGMGSEAMYLLKALKDCGIEVQPIHPWKKVLIPQYIEEYKPIFLRETEEEPELSSVIKDMVDVINSDTECNIFCHFGSPNWACVIPYLRPDIRIVVSVHSITPSALKIATAYNERVSRFVAISWELENILYNKLNKNIHNKISLITNALDINKYTEKVYNKNAITKIVFFGRIEDYTKGCDKIPPIAKILKDKGLNFEWDFYGYFHWGYENRFYKLNKEYSVEDIITYKGCLQPEEINDTISKYDIMVMPSNHEGFGLALIEAMAMGLTCVASKINNVTDKILAHKKEGYLCNRNNISEFANYIYEAANNFELRKEIGRAARKKVIENFTLEVQGEKYKKLFTEIIAENNYSIIQPNQSLENFKQPNMVKPHILARILPTWFKRILKKYI